MKRIDATVRCRIEQIMSRAASCGYEWTTAQLMSRTGASHSTVLAALRELAADGSADVRRDYDEDTLYWSWRKP